MPTPCAPEGRLLAVDLGLRCGLAVYGRDGRLRSYGSRNFGTTARLRRAADHVLSEHPGLEWLVVEGDRMLGELWARRARRHGTGVLRVAPERWREALLLPRDRRSAADAKRTADRLAREVVVASGLPRPTSLRHDAAEAILIGLWGVREVGWVEV